MIGRLVALAALVGCSRLPSYRCDTNEQCVVQGAAGFCEDTGWCSATDPGCPSGRRYVHEAGEGLSEQCVPEGPAADGGDGGDGPPDARLIDAEPGLDPPWWDQSYLSRVPITIVNDSADPLPEGFSVMMPVPSFTSDLDELRLARWDGIEWVDSSRYIDDFGGNRRLWFRLDVNVPPKGRHQAFWFYWGDTSPPSPLGDLDEVFDVFQDDFTGASLDGGRWIELNAGTVSLAGGDLLLEAGESVRSTSVFNAGYAIDFALDFPGAVAFSWGGFQRENDFVQDQPWLLWIDREGDDSLVAESRIDVLGDTAPVVSGTPFATGTISHLFTIERYATRVVYAVDGETTTSRASLSGFTQPLQIWLRNGGGGPGAPLRFGFVRVRVIVDSAPTVELGEEQVRP